MAERFLNIANQITIFRVVIIAYAIVLLSVPSIQSPAAIALIGLSFALDGLDGWVARTLKLETKFGSFLDVLGDRATELLLWSFFLWKSLVPYWAVAIVLVRDLIVDSIRSKAMASGKSVYGMIESDIGKALVSGPAIRGLYALLKAALFISLAWVLLYETSIPYYVNALLWVVIGLNLLRAYPVIAEGRRYFS